MQEVLTAVTYLVTWLICQRVLGIESGLTNLIISLSAAIAVYVIIAIRDHKKKMKERDE
jgi:hypothetical protein